MPRGQKTCPQCQATTGPATALCKCGYNFQKKPPVVQTVKPVTAPVVAPPKPVEAVAKAAPIAETASEQATAAPIVPEQEPENEPVRHTGRPAIYALAGKQPPYQGNLRAWLNEVEAGVPDYELTPEAAVVALRAQFADLGTVVKDQISRLLAGQA